MSLKWQIYIHILVLYFRALAQIYIDLQHAKRYFTHMYKTNTRQCHVSFNLVTLYSIYFLQLHQQCHALFNRCHAPFERCHVFASLNRVAVNHSCYSCEIFAEQMIATEDGQNRHEEGSPRMPTKQNASSVCTWQCKFIKVTFNFCLFNFVTFSLLFFNLLSNSTTTPSIKGNYDTCTKKGH